VRSLPLLLLVLPFPPLELTLAHPAAFLFSLVGVIAYLAYVVFVLPSIVRPSPCSSKMSPG